VTRTPVDSSNVHSVGHDETGLEVQFHRTGCARGTKPPKGETIQAGCNCTGGDVWHYPMQEDLAATHHLQMMGGSAGAYFHQHVKTAKDSCGGLRFPGVKRAANPS
jgi:hypothetical protein